MRDILIDIVRQTSGLFDVLKVTSSDTETKLQAVDADKTLFLEASLKEPVPEFAGEFGLTNLNLLKGLLEFASYRTDQAEFTVKRHARGGKETVEQFEFKDANKKGAIFRLMSADLVPEQAVIANIPWDVTITPNKSKLTEFQQLAKLYAEVDKFFGVKTDGRDLVFTIGDENSSTHRAAMVFESDVDGALSGQILWSIPQFLSVMNLAAAHTAEVRITARGVLCVEVETPHGLFKYYLRAKR